jgi:acyl-CoA synthetase (NDP forming)
LANFPTPERAAKAMAHLWQYQRLSFPKSGTSFPRS